MASRNRAAWSADSVADDGALRSFKIVESDRTPRFEAEELAVDRVRENNPPNLDMSRGIVHPP